MNARAVMGAATHCALCVVLALPFGLASPAAGGELPRVFFAPGERAAITANRAKLLAGQLIDTAPAAASVASSGDAPSKPAAESSLHLEGVSQTSGGKAYAWINGRRYEEGELVRGQRLRIQRNAVVLVARSGATRRLLVGEKVAAGAMQSAAQP